MKRVLTLLVVSVFLVGALAGCSCSNTNSGNNKSNETTNSSASAERKTGKELGLLDQVINPEKYFDSKSVNIINDGVNDYNYMARVHSTDRAAWDKYKQAYLDEGWTVSYQNNNPDKVDNFTVYLDSKDNKFSIKLLGTLSDGYGDIVCSSKSK